MITNKIVGSKVFIIVLILCGLFLCYVFFFQASSLNAWSHNIISNFLPPPTSFYFRKEEIPEISMPLDTGQLDNLFKVTGQFAHILEKKVAAADLKRATNLRPTCDDKFKLANSCSRTCLQKDLPKNLTTRVEQLVAPSQLQMSPWEHKILREMGDKVNGIYDIILLTAASSNHYFETQGLLKNLHENVFPHLKNFTLVFYNLGLKEQQRSLMVKYCKCQVMDFPFDKFPNSVSNLGCYSWKPILIKSHLHKANVVFWMDASVRFHNYSGNFRELINKTRERGVQIGGDDADNTFRTYRSMFHFFGDEPCAYLKYKQAQATYGLYHREYFVDRAILEPWVACAINEDCMCPNVDTRTDCAASNRMADNYYNKEGPLVYGLCHRFDQSAISLILHKLYQDIYPWVMVDVNSYLAVWRDHKIYYFPASRK